MTSQMTKTKSPPYVSLGPCHGPMTMIFLSVSITVPMHQMHSVHVCFGVSGDYMIVHHTQLVFIATILFPIALLPHVASLIYLFSTIQSVINWVPCRFIVTHIRLSLRSRQRVIIFRAVSFFLFLWLLFSGFSGCVAFKFASASQTVRDVANMLLLPSHNV